MLSTLTLQLRNSEMELHHALRNLKDEMTKQEVSRNTLDILCER
jgi:hypothetical protein